MESQHFMLSMFHAQWKVRSSWSYLSWNMGSFMLKKISMFTHFYNLPWSCHVFLHVVLKHCSLLWLCNISKNWTVLSIHVLDWLYTCTLSNSAFSLNQFGSDIQSTQKILQCTYFGNSCSTSQRQQHDIM